MVAFVDGQGKVYGVETVFARKVYLWNQPQPKASQDQNNYTI